MASSGEDVYATLLLNDFYLPGALVLAHSLRDAGTTKKLAVLVTTDGVSVDAMVELRKVFDFTILVDRVVNDTPANLYLMDRADLQSTFTKITLWKQTQFRRIVYMDADMVALRAPDELFDLPQPFSAAPDIGWPDIFNTGLMVLNPNLGDYYALLAMAQRGISFDGADQGLLNIHFKNSYNRLSFSYNVTPSAHYQYLPAYRHFQSTISAAHFIGQAKPWSQGRDANKGSTPYDEMVGRWWAVYDRHFRESSSDSTPIPAIVQYHTKGEFQPEVPIVSSSQEYQPEETEKPEPVLEPVHVHHYSAWDASRAPPPSDSKPEAENFPSAHYDMSSDPTPFKAPERYPDPPKDMYYEVPKTPTYQKPAPIFPWEKDAPKPTRVFLEDNYEVAESQNVVDPEPAPADDDIRASFSHGTRNAWDDIPEIERYIGALSKNRKGNIQVLQGYGAEMERPSLPVTPAPIRRPSFWGEERDEEGKLPAAEGVPSQEDWDPAAQLEQLARRQSDVLANKLGTVGGQIPMRQLPYGSEGVISPTYIPPNAPRSTIPEPSYGGPSAAWEKDETFPIQETPLPPSEEEKDVLEN